MSKSTNRFRPGQRVTLPDASIGTVRRVGPTLPGPAALGLGDVEVEQSNATGKRRDVWHASQIRSF